MMFSVVIPCFNSKDSIRKCLDSILAQTYRDFEIVIIDNGSNDGTSEILNEYANEYNYVRVYRFINAGVSYARRRGIVLATGDYLIFVDSDDTINSGLLQKFALTIKQHDSPDIIRHQANLVGDATHKNHQRYNFNCHLNVPLTGIDALKHWSISGKKYAVYWLFAFKRTIFSNVLFTINLRCYEDVALIPILIASSEKVVTIEYIGYNYTCNNPDSLTNNQSLEAERARALDFIKAYKYAIEHFCKLNHVSSLDIAFFYEDFTNRLRKKYCSLPESLKSELADAFRL